jgi:hypothetical protein
MTTRESSEKQLASAKSPFPLSPPTTMSSPPPEPAAKRQKTSNEGKLPFYPGLLDSSNVEKLAKDHSSSEPYKHAVINQLFDQDFLRKARKEITEQLSFTEKETDICENRLLVSSFHHLG